MNNEVITFNDVNKVYKIYKNRPSTLKEQLLNKLLRRNKLEVIEHKVLDNATFTINKGETIGIIGRNGAGKSTILKLIANIIPPDKGEVIVIGSLSSLLEIGAGFQPDLTGRENVYLYGSILGLSKKYIQEHYDKIVEFSELGNFMDTAVKNYSSGMYMRLAFSVAIHVDPEILIIDEVLAVGDANFQKKCINKLMQFQKNNKTIVFVSHDMSSVRQLCNRVIFIDNEGVIQVGETDRLVNLYFSKLYGSTDEMPLLNINEETTNEFSINHELPMHINEEFFFDPNYRWGNNKLKFNKIYFSNSSGFASNVFNVNTDIVINLEVQAEIPQYDVVVGLAVYDEKGNHLSGPNSKIDGLVIEAIEGVRVIKVVLRQPPFLQGTYLVSIALYDYDCQEPFIFMEKNFKFHVVNEREEYGTVSLKCDWIF